MKGSTILFIAATLGAAAAHGAANPFLTACESQSKTPSQQGFFKDVFEQTRGQDCQEAYDALVQKKWLKIRDQRIEDIEPLRDYPEAIQLDFSTTNLEDISAISSMPKVNSLHFEGTPAIDFSPLRSLTTLNYLHLKNLATEVAEDILVAVRDSSTLLQFAAINTALNDGAQRSVAMMTTIETLVLVGDRNLKSIDFIEPLTAIRWLVLEDVDVTDISVVKKFTAMTVFHGVFLPLRDISPLTVHADSMYGISLEYVPSADLSTLKAFAKLNSLWLTGMNLTKIPDLSHYTGLRHLRLRNNNIADLANFKDDDRVGWLELQNNLVTDLTPLKNAKWLKSLGIAGNPLGTTVDKTEANCPTDGTNDSIKAFCKKK